MAKQRPQSAKDKEPERAEDEKERPVVTSEVEKLVKAIRDVYRRHNPEKDVSAILAKHKGLEADLYHEVCLSMERIQTC